jgi:hypothetical protein
MGWINRNIHIMGNGVPSNFAGRPRTAMVSTSKPGVYHLAFYGYVNEGHIVIVTWDGSDWTKLGIEKPTAGARVPLAAGDPFLTETAAGRHIIYRDRDSNLVELRSLAGATEITNITKLTSTPFQVSQPKVLNQIVWPGNIETLFVHVRDQLGTIREFSLSPGGPWTVNPLTGASYPSATVGELANLLGTTTTSGGVRRSIYFVGSDSNVHELEHDDEGWHHRNLTALTKAPLAATTPDAYFEPTDDTKKHVVYVGKDQKIHELWCRYDGKNQWHHHNLSSTAGGPSADLDLGLCGYWQDMTQTQHVIYCDVVGGIHELWLTNGKTWKHSDLSTKTNIWSDFYPAAATKSRSTPFGSERAPQGAAMKQHVLVRDRTSNDLILLYEWEPPPEPGPELSNDWVPSGDFDEPGDDPKVTVWSGGEE